MDEQETVTRTGLESIGTEISEISALALAGAKAHVLDVIEHNKAGDQVGFTIKSDITLRPRADADVYPGLYDQDKLSQCYRLFLLGSGVDECAAATGANKRTVAKWVASGGWALARQETVDAAAADEAQRLTLMRIEERAPEVEKQIKAGQKLRKLAEIAMDSDDLRPSDLKNIGETLKTATEVTNRAMGLSESGQTEAVVAKEEKSGKAPLIVIIQGGGLPPARVAQTIDV